MNLVPSSRRLDGFRPRLFHSLILSIFVFFAPFSLLAEPTASATLHGVVTDESSGTLVRGATVTIQGTDLSTTTDRQGEFHFVGLKPGTYGVDVSYGNAPSTHADLVLPEGESVLQTVKLRSDVLKLTPFIVDVSEDKGTYLASSTLAGTRVRTDLNDIASSLSIVTAQFMQDTGATNNRSLLVYTPNTEVGGVSGNFAGVGNTFISGANESATLSRPDQNTRVRGLDSADNTRDYFRTDIPWDSYIVDRVDLQRGPNSILFGIGSPAGIINASINMASFHEAYKLENRVGSFGSLRNSLDFNHVLLPDELAIRVAALDNDTKYRQDPAFNHDRRIFGSLYWDPKFFRTESAHTTFHANYEHGDVKSNNPRILPPVDAITPFFSSSAINKVTWDPAYAWDAGIQASAGTANPTLPGLTRNPWITGGMAPGIQQLYNPMFYYNNLTSASAAVSAVQGSPYLYYGIGPDGQRTGGIAGMPYNTYSGIATYAQYAVNNNRYNPSDPTTRGAQAGFYKDKSLTDPSIFDFYNHLIDGPNKKEWQGWDAFNLVLDQTFFNGRLAFDLAYDHQKYDSGAESNLPSSPVISVDINANTTKSAWAYNNPAVISYNGTGSAGTNPNDGAAFVGGSGASGGNNSFFSTRDNLRATAMGELRATDLLRKSWLTDLLGRHVFTGLYSKETYNTETRKWDRYALSPDWLRDTGNGDPAVNGLIGGQSVIDWVSYLSKPLFSASSASGLYLQPITSVQSPTGTAKVQWFNSRWNRSTNPSDPNYVNPAAPWTNPTTLSNQASSLQVQAYNPANYVGWTNGTYNILNADNGDIDSLYTAGTKIRTMTDSVGLTWQGFLWKDTIAATVGWRRDTQEQQSGNAAISPVTGAASMDFGLKPLDPITGKVTGDSKSWGVVLHEPVFLRNKLPWGTNVSLFYDIGQNARVQNRYAFDGSALPNAKGTTKDYGFTVRTMNDSLQLKVTWYDTKVKDANISSVTSTTSTLGANTYFLNNAEITGTEAALIDKAGMAGAAIMPSWYWNWAWADASYSYVGYPNNNWIGDPTSAAFQNAPATAKEKAAVDSWLTQMQPQSFFDAYGYKVNVAAAKSGDYINAIPGYPWAQGAGYLSAPGAGLINGVPPTGTVDNESKGIEFEVIGQVTKNWNISFNASKQQAQQISLGSQLVDFITAQHDKMLSPAGDLRFYGAGDQTIRQYYESYIWGPFQFQQKTNGKMVSEMSPWRANLVTTYSFDRGTLKGLFAGLGYRWQQGTILGYALLADGSNLDITKPFWGESQHATDLWVGYSHKLTGKIGWRIQLNLRSVGQKARLIPISVEPDGSPAQYRIQEGQTWELTNTLSF